MPLLALSSQPASGRRLFHSPSANTISGERTPETIGKVKASPARNSISGRFPSEALRKTEPSSDGNPIWTEKSSARQALFGRIAPVYDNLNDLLSLGQHRIWKRMAVSWSGAKNGDCVLDLCCGSGDLAFLLAEKVGCAGQVTGLDFSKDQLSIASTRQEMLGKACYKNILWIEGDALNLPFRNCCFDAVTVGYGLRNLVDKPKALQEIHRVLRPGSRVSILDFNKSMHTATSFIQEWSIDNIVVPIANGYGLGMEYAYLKSSIAEFLTGRELEKAAFKAGFSNAKHYEIAGGLMGNLVATR